MLGDDKLKALMTIIKYSDEDLQSNRQGNLSGRQKQLIGNSATKMLLVFVLVGLFFGGMLIVLADQPLTGNVIAVSGLLGGVYIVIGVFLFWLQRRDRVGGIVKCGVGVIKILPREMGYLLCVDDVQLPIAYDIQALIDENVMYKVYYTPTDRRTVSLEKCE